MAPARQRQRGETLTGLLIGMGLGLLVLAAGTHMLAQLMRGQRWTLQDTHLQQDMHFAMDLMVRELRNAQHTAQAWRTRSPQACTDDFCDSSADFSIENNRIEFSTDRNHNGVQDNNECMGFKVTDGVLSRRTGCQSSGWQPLSDKTTVVVDRLQVRLLCTGADGWLHRHLSLQIDAHGPDDPQRQLHLQRQVAVANPLPAAVQGRFCP